MSDAPFETVAVVIPAARPSDALADLVDALSAAGFASVVVVDDGAGPASRSAFERLAQTARVHVVHHAVELGTGGALKSGFHGALSATADLTGVVSARPDSAFDDIRRTAELLVAQPATLIFDAAPGSGTSRTAPRGIPASLARDALKIESSGDDFERKLVKLARRQSVAISGVPSRAPSPGIFAAMIGLVLAAGLAAEWHGLRTANIFVEDIWEPNGWRRFLHYLAIFLLVTVPLMALAPWTYIGMVVSLATAATAVVAGPLALLAVLLFLVSACALGSRLLDRSPDCSLPGQALATVVGTAVYIFLMTLLARQPVNYPVVWLAILALPIAFDWPGVRRRTSAVAKALFGAELRGWGERAAAALLAFVLGMHWMVAMKPEISADGLAMHLAVPVNIAAQHHLTYEPTRFIWAVMPMGADWIYAIVYQLGGEMASRLVNFAMLLLVVVLVYGGARRWLNSGAALLLAALFASTPMVQLVTGSLFVENVLAALVLAMLTAVWRIGETGGKRYLFAAAILAGGAMATKFGALAFVFLTLPFAVYEITRVWRRLSTMPALTCGIALVLFVATAVPTYAIAYQKTHNPLFPFLNRKFPGPILDPTVETMDTRYHDPVVPGMLYDLTFRTENYYEARNGSFGFQYLALAPLLLAGLLVVRSRPAVGAAILSLAASIAVLKSTSNARYIYPALPVATVGFAAIAGWAASHNRTLLRVLLGCTVVWAGLNIYFIPASGWYHREFYSPFLFSRDRVDRYLSEKSPERLVIQHYNKAHPEGVLLLTSDTNIADVKGEVYENSWHQWNNAIAIQHTASVADLRKLFEKWKVTYFLAPVRQTGVNLQPPWLRDFLDYCTSPEFERGGYELSHMASACKAETTHTSEARIDTRPLVPVGAGMYDDFDDSLHYNGDWEQNRTFNGPLRHTITFTDAENASVRFAFSGQAVTYVFSLAPNRGFAEIGIDGHDRGIIDLYASKTVWQSSRKFTVGPGQHVIEVRVMGKKSPGSSGTFVDVDAFQVE